MTEIAYSVASHEKPDNSQPAARLENAARASAKWDVVHRPSGPGSFPARIRAATRALAELDRELARQGTASAAADSSRDPGHAALFELRVHQRVMRAALLAVCGQRRLIERLPRVLLDAGREEPRVAAIARVYLGAVGGDFSAPTFLSLIQALQAHEPLMLEEIWSVTGFLQFVLLESLLRDTRVLLHKTETGEAPALTIRLTSLRAAQDADWVYLIEPLIVFDALLRQDPDDTYAKMDFESRQLYRQRVALISQYSDLSEMEVAQAALDLARQGGERPNGDPRMRRRRIHVGYYLVDKGFSRLVATAGFHPPLSWRVRHSIRSNAEDYYLGGIFVLSCLILFLALFPVLPRIGTFIPLAIAILALLPSAMQSAVDLINLSITALFDPEPLPKLDFSKGIAGDCATVVVVPTLLLNEKQVRKLVNDLEVRFLANRDRSLHFALLTDLADSVSKPRERDSHPLVELAIRLIDELNAKYEASGSAFLLLHRHRVYNARQGVWMGWERKRGKLLDLNKFLAGEFDAFPIKAGRIDLLRQVRYVLTLDSDTQLPRGEAARLVGAIAHPLNQAVIDQKLRVVTAGFGILQPRIGVAVRSVARSRLATIYSGQSGFDIYTRARSDAYQDLFGEGIFTGKGIYEAATFHAVLDRRFPRNALLSHDLIEGAYARAGLAADIELVDDYPSHYSAYMRRKHRWFRGDWQIAQWLFARVPDESGHWGENPISAISRWKIFDNLRRSLVDPFLLILFMAGWLRLPGGPVYWTLVALLLLIFPAVAQFAFGLGRALLSGRKELAGDAFSGFERAALVAFLRLVFLCHETMLTFDAIVRSMVRRFITGQRLLEWETAAQSEEQGSSSTPVDRYLAATPFLAAGLGALVWFLAGHRAMLCAAPILVLWALATPITVWLNRPPRDVHRLNTDEREFLLAHALRIWRYFREFGVERHNYLIPDNVMEEGFCEAPRVSPTNVGLLLNARQAACELGFLTAPEYADLTRRTLASMERMEKYRGHLYNWYDTETLRPLDGAPPFISSVDSGNLAASLYTLEAGTRLLTKKPLAGADLFVGVQATMRLLRAEKLLPATLSRNAMPASPTDVPAWMAWLEGARAELATAAASQPEEQKHNAWWIAESLHRVEALLTLLQEYLPWTLPAFAPLRALRQLNLDGHADRFTCGSALVFAERLHFSLASAGRTLAGNAALAELADRLHALLPKAIEKLHALDEQLHDIERDAERMAQQMEFAFLVDPNRQVLSIGYEMGKQQRHAACYDMLASEARIATFLAIARGDLRQASWGKLGRDQTLAYGRFLLLSWSGTMFEYLMPAVWMRSYPGTLIARTQDAVVRVQQAFAGAWGIPWGISESGSAHKNDRGHYHYFAYGIPKISLWVDAAAGPVISPYSTFLALAVDPEQAIKNLRRMDKAGWVGSYGLYEAADYSASTRNPVLVREWMAHHLGMSLLAITNLLHHNAVQQWFHANPIVQASELLLHELPVSNAVLKAKQKELAPAA